MKLGKKVNLVKLQWQNGINSISWLTMSRFDEILTFWFSNANVWFNKNPQFDEELKSLFLEDYQKAAAGKLNDWLSSPQSCLALILLLDQFPRNCFRGQPQAFATDTQALTTAKYAVANGFDSQLPLTQRLFIYLPFEHSENLADQHRSVELFQQFSSEPELAHYITYAISHCEVIERFGRFPHRNQILGRVSTPLEIEFLKQPGSSF